MKDKKLLWSLARIIGFSVTGIFNTLLIQTKDIGKWNNYFGYGFLFLAVIEIVCLVKHYWKVDDF